MKKLQKVLFGNIGRLLKDLAIIIFFIESLAGFTVGIALAIYEREAIFLIISGATPIAAYLLNAFLYGFAELVYNSTKIANKDKNTSHTDILPKL